MVDGNNERVAFIAAMRNESDRIAAECMEFTGGDQVWAIRCLSAALADVSIRPPGTVSRGQIKEVVMASFSQFLDMYAEERGIPPSS